MNTDSFLNDLSPASAGTVRPVITEQGVRVEIVPPLMSGQQVAVDYCSLTVAEEVLRRISPDKKPFVDSEYALVLADYVVDHLLLITHDGKRPAYKPLPRGIFGYSYAYQIGNYGLVAAGGNGSSMYVSLTGHAFACADVGMCKRIYDFLVNSGTARMTRIDLCHDDFDGKVFSPDQMFDAWHQDKFTAKQGSKKRPRLEKRGDWDRGDPDNRGRTLYIGARTSGRLMRFYEKGKQLGDVQSTWCRAEVELRNNTFHLVPEMLLNPTGFFIACAPVFALVGFTSESKKLERIAREGVASVERVIEIIRIQYGVHLNCLRQEFFATDSELLDAITRTGVIPPALSKSLDLFKATETPAGATN